MIDQIREQPALKDTPFVLLSSKRLEPSESVLKCESGTEACPKSIAPGRYPSDPGTGTLRRCAAP